MTSQTLESALGRLADFDKTNVEHRICLVEEETRRVEKQLKSLQDDLLTSFATVRRTHRELSTRVLNLLAKIKEAQIGDDRASNPSNAKISQAALESQHSILSDIWSSLVLADQEIMRDLLRVFHPTSDFFDAFESKRSETSNRISEWLTVLLGGAGLVPQIGTPFSILSLFLAIKKAKTKPETIGVSIGRVRDFLIFDWYLQFLADRGLSRLESLVEKRREEATNLLALLRRIADLADRIETDIEV